MSYGQPPYGGGYGAPPPNPYGAGYGGAAPQSANGLAIASLVVSLVGICLCGGITGVVGAILGHVARRQIKAGQGTGDGMALAGIIVGWITFVLSIIGIILYVALIGWAITEADDCYTNSSGEFVCN